MCLTIENVLSEFKIVPRGTILQKYNKYKDLFEKWNNKINLTSRSQDVSYVLQKSFLEAIQISKFLDAQDRVLDIGSGGGLPGVLLGILGYKVSLIEINKKKCVFLQYVVNELNIAEAVVINDDVKNHRGLYNVITSKAVSSIEEIFKWSKHLINENTRIILPKSENQLSEVEELKGEWLFELQKYENKFNSKDILLIFESIAHQ